MYQFLFYTLWLVPFVVAVYCGWLTWLNIRRRDTMLAGFIGALSAAMFAIAFLFVWMIFHGPSK